MNDSEATFALVKKRLAEFNTERDWDRYHNPKDLAVSISIESAELLENFQWQPARTAEEIGKDTEKLEKIKDEMADLFIYLFILSNQLNIDVAAAVHEKIEKNEERFSIGTTF
jgi:NTP pyrophosphatase (non-canonical NTP hydrolase)